MRKKFDLDAVRDDLTLYYDHLTFIDKGSVMDGYRDLTFEMRDLLTDVSSILSMMNCDRGRDLIDDKALRLTITVISDVRSATLFFEDKRVSRFVSLPSHLETRVHDTVLSMLKKWRSHSHDARKYISELLGEKDYQGIQDAIKDAYEESFKFDIAVYALKRSDDTDLPEDTNGDGPVKEGVEPDIEGASGLSSVSDNGQDGKQGMNNPKSEPGKDEELDKLIESVAMEVNSDLYVTMVRNDEEN